MREIKFRAWDKKTKKMRAVNSIVFHYEEECFDFDNSRLPKVVNLWGKDIIEDKAIVLHREIKDVELMQYTGLKDKNGKEIYEGDIVKTYDAQGNESCIAQILWADYGLNDGWCSKGIKSLIEYDKRLFEIGFGKSDARDCEVIGNKFDNPELLEGGAE